MQLLVKLLCGAIETKGPNTRSKAFESSDISYCATARLKRSTGTYQLLLFRKLKGCGSRLGNGDCVANGNDANLPAANMLTVHLY